MHHRKFMPSRGQYIFLCFGLLLGVVICYAMRPALPVRTAETDLHLLPDHLWTMMRMEDGVQCVRANDLKLPVQAECFDRNGRTLAKLLIDRDAQNESTAVPKLSLFLTAVPEQQMSIPFDPFWPPGELPSCELALHSPVMQGSVDCSFDTMSAGDYRRVMWQVSLTDGTVKKTMDCTETNFKSSGDGPVKTVSERTCINYNQPQ